MTPRIYVPPENLSAKSQPGAHLELRGDELHYLLRVMRAKPGDTVQLFDGQGQRCLAQLISADKQRATLETGSWSNGPGTQSLTMQLIQGLSATEKMDWTVEKAVELGVNRIQPVFTRRSMIRLDPERAQNKLLHWQRLAIAACRQCGRDQLPEICLPVQLETWLSEPSLANRHRLLLSVPTAGAPAVALSDWQPAGQPPAKGSLMAIDLLIGPEAGFDPEEEHNAQRAGFLPVQIGNLILRTETAGLAAAAALQLRFGTF